MSHPQRKQGNERVTYGDYLHWPDDERWELIDGVLMIYRLFDRDGEPDVVPLTGETAVTAIVVLIIRWPEAEPPASTGYGSP